MCFWSLISNMKFNCLPISKFLFWLTCMASFSVLRLWRTYAHSHLKKNSKRTNYRLINCHILLKSVLLKLNLQDEGHLYPGFYIFILTICCKCLLFQFFSCDILTHIPNLTGLQNGRLSRQKNSHILLKNVIFEAYFLRWRSLVFQFLLFFILTIYRKFLLVEFFGWGLRIHLPILTGFKKDALAVGKLFIYCEKYLSDFFCDKSTFRNLNFKWKVIWKLITSLIFSVFNVNHFFLSCGIRMHIPIVTGGWKSTKWRSKKWSYYSKKLLKIDFKTKVFCMAISWFLFWLFINNTFFFGA